MGRLGLSGLEKLLTSEPENITANLIQNVLFHHESGVDFLLASARPGDAYLNTAQEQFIKITQLIPYQADIVILDLGSAITPSVDAVLEFCQRLIIVLEPSPQSVLRTRLLLEYLRSKNINLLQIHPVLIDRIGDGTKYSAEQIQEDLKLELSAIISSAAGLALQAQIIRTPMVLCEPDGLIAKQYASLAKLVI